MIPATPTEVKVRSYGAHPFYDDLCAVVARNSNVTGFEGYPATFALGNHHAPAVNKLWGLMLTTTELRSVTPPWPVACLGAAYDHTAKVGYAVTANWARTEGVGMYAVRIPMSADGRIDEAAGFGLGGPTGPAFGGASTGGTIDFGLVAADNNVVWFGRKDEEILIVEPYRWIGRLTRAGAGDRRTLTLPEAPVAFAVLGDYQVVFTARRAILYKNFAKVREIIPPTSLIWSLGYAQSARYYSWDGQINTGDINTIKWDAGTWWNRVMPTAIAGLIPGPGTEPLVAWVTGNKTLVVSEGGVITPLPEAVVPYGHLPNENNLGALFSVGGTPTRTETDVVVAPSAARKTLANAAFDADGNVRERTASRSLVEVTAPVAAVPDDVFGQIYCDVIHDNVAYPVIGAEHDGHTATLQIEVL